MTIIAAFAVSVFLYGLVSSWLERTILTAPILFIAAGILRLCSPAVLVESEADGKNYYEEA